MSQSMAFRDRMQQALVYFGLAEERVDRYDYADADVEDYAERPAPTRRVARAPVRRRSCSAARPRRTFNPRADLWSPLRQRSAIDR